MEGEKNELESLSERLGQVVLTKFSPDPEGDLDAVCKAKLIISEIAKLESYTALDGKERFDSDEATEALLKCRKIAKEGTLK